MYKLSLIENPNGTYSFVGCVPYKLGFVFKNDKLITENDYSSIDDDLRLPSNYRKFKTRVFQTKTEAILEATKLNISLE